LQSKVSEIPKKSRWRLKFSSKAFFLKRRKFFECPKYSLNNPKFSNIFFKPTTIIWKWEFFLKIPGNLQNPYIFDLSKTLKNPEISCKFTFVTIFEYLKFVLNLFLELYPWASNPRKNAKNIKIFEIETFIFFLFNYFQYGTRHWKNVFAYL